MPNQKKFVDRHLEHGIRLISEGQLYGRDPQYTETFNLIAQSPLFRYQRGSRKDCGEVYSLAYAVHKNISCFCTRYSAVDILVDDHQEFSVEILTLDFVLLNSYLYYAKRSSRKHLKALKSIYKNTALM